MIRKFSYTGLVKLAKDTVNIRLNYTQNFAFEAEINKKILLSKFPYESPIVIEASDRFNYERFELGELGSVDDVINRSLAEVFKENANTNLFFNLKVLSPDRLGCLLGHAKKIKCHDPENSNEQNISILKHKFEDLGYNIWDLDLDDEDVVSIITNSNLSDPSLIKDSGRFASLVFPEVVRRILENILIIDESNWVDADDPEVWQTQWLLYAKLHLNNDPIPKKNENVREVIDWINTCVSEFNRKQRYLDHINTCYPGVE